MVSKPVKMSMKKLITSFSPNYFITKKHIAETEFFSKEQFKTFQFEKVKDTLKNAFNNVPYYKKVFRDSGFHPDQFKCLEDLGKVPFLDKSIYRENSAEIISTKSHKKLLPKVYTGGTTGTPLLLSRSFSDYSRERAFTEYAYKMTGMNHAVKTVYIRGKVSDERGCYHRIMDFGRTLYLSSHNMKDAQLKFYVKLIRESGGPRNV